MGHAIFLKMGVIELALRLPGMTMVAPSPGPKSVMANKMLIWISYLKRSVVKVKLGALCMGMTAGMEANWLLPGPRKLAKFSSIKSGPWL
ncbi:MAG: hypothetical protein R2867_07475 [Caldilineaceae bacterium]